jgi:uncharacterized UBP type Zn finger protein
MPPKVSTEAYMILLAYGIDKNRAIKALVATGGTSIDAALDWLDLHMDDETIDHPCDMPVLMVD